MTAYLLDGILAGLWWCGWTAVLLATVWPDEPVDDWPDLPALLRRQAS